MSANNGSRKERQPELPGIPPRPPLADKYQNLHETIEQLHWQLSQFEIPRGAKITIDRVIEGDVLTITLKTGA